MDEPTEVVITGQHVPVEVTGEIVQPLTATQEAEKAAATRAEAIPAGQRRVNLIWELTQAIIAIMVTLVVLDVAREVVRNGDVAGAAFLLLSNAFFLVIGFYFGRTNHQRTGGVGPTDIGR